MGRKVMLSRENRAELLREARMLEETIKNTINDISDDAPLRTIREDIDSISLLARRLTFIASKRGESNALRRTD